MGSILSTERWRDRNRWALGFCYRLLARVARWAYYLLAPDVTIRLLKRHLTLFALMFVFPTLFRKVLWPLGHRLKLLRLRLTKGRRFADRYGRLSRGLENAHNYEEFKAIAGALDTLDGLDAWKRNPISRHYHYAQVAKDCDELVSLLRRCREEEKHRRKRQSKTQRLKRRRQREQHQIGKSVVATASLRIDVGRGRHPVEDTKEEDTHFEFDKSSKLVFAEVLSDDIDSDSDDVGDLPLASKKRRTLSSRLSNSTKSMRTLYQVSGGSDDESQVPAMHELMEFLRSRVRRNYCGINNPKLHFCRTGTKQLITRFNALLCSALRYVARSDHTQVSIAEKLVFLKETRHAMGRTALCLSGGSGTTFGFGAVISLLARQKLLPNIVSGSSGGSFAAAYICSHTPQEMDRHWRKTLPRNVYPLTAFGNYQPFASYWDAFKSRIRCLWQRGNCSEKGATAYAVRLNFGDITFQEAYNKTGRLLNITVSGSKSNVTPRLLNHLTAPNVCIWSAIAASAAMPGILDPGKLYVKRKRFDAETGAERVTVNPVGFGGRQFSDGSLAFDLPMKRLQQLFNVNNFVVGQVNPHIVPFLFHHVSGPWLPLDRFFYFLGSELRMFARSLLENLSGLPLPGVRSMKGMVAQKYTGHVTIVPDMSFGDYSKLATNLSATHLTRVMRICEKSTWRVFSRLRGLCAAELCIDECIVQLTTEALSMQQKLVDTLKTRVSTFEAPLRTPTCSTPQFASSMQRLLEADTGDFKALDDCRRFNEVTSSPWRSMTPPFSI